jgi:hypothetical protein
MGLTWRCVDFLTGPSDYALSVWDRLPLQRQFDLLVNGSDDELLGADEIAGWTKEVGTFMEAARQGCLWGNLRSQER